MAMPATPTRHAVALREGGSPATTGVGRVKPIAFFPFHYEVSKTCGIGFVVARLRDQVEATWLHLAAVQRGLLLHHFDSPIEHLPSEPVDGDMYPVMLFAFNSEIVLQALGIGLVVTRLRDQVDH